VNLSFRLGKIPVRIQPSFFVMAVLFGVLSDERDVASVAAWVAIVLGSVLLHELGHATVGVAFGLSPQIDLHGMGGTTSWAPSSPLSSPKRIAISLAGPFAGFALAVIVRFAIGPHVFAPTRLGTFVYVNLWYVNFYWGVLNLIPMLPLDGGNVMSETLRALTGGGGQRAAHVVSIVFASLGIVASLLTQNIWPALLAASFIALNVRGLKALTAREHDEPMRAALAQAYAALDAKDGAGVLALARPVALQSKSEPVRAEALQLVAFGFLLEGRVADADAALAALPPGYSPHPKLLDLRARTAG
jgi:Zn-dependent protease